MKRIEITVGVGFDRHGLALSKFVVDIAIEHTVKGLTEFYGGVTTFKGMGSYLHDDGRVVTEPIVTFVILGAKVERARKLAVYLKHELNQESVVFQVTETEGEFL